MKISLSTYFICTHKCIQMFSIVAFGNPLLDIIANIKNNKFLIKYDIKPDDQKEISDNDMKNLYKDISDLPKIITPGGCAQNTLRVMQWILESQIKTVFFGTIGNDEQGKLLTNLLKKDKVLTKYQINEKHVTGMCIALVKEDHRSLLANVNAAEHFNKDELQNDLESIEIIKNTKLIYIEACFLPKRLDSVEFIEKLCIKYNKILVFNLSAAYLFDIEPNAIEHFAKTCHILFGNKREYYALGKLMKINKVRTLAIDLSKTFNDYDHTNPIMRYGKIIVVTNGSKSIKCFYENGKVFETKVRSVEPEKIVDTISAGDAFVGGFLTSLMKGNDIENCLDWGQKAALQIIMQPGCTIPNYSAKTIFGNI